MQIALRSMKCNLTAIIDTLAQIAEYYAEFCVCSTEMYSNIWPICIHSHFIGRCLKKKTNVLLKYFQTPSLNYGLAIVKWSKKLSNSFEMLRTEENVQQLLEKAVNISENNCLGKTKSPRAKSVSFKIGCR